MSATMSAAGSAGRPAVGRPPAGGACRSTRLPAPPSGRPRTARSQRGAALLTAIVTVALIATLASGMLWQQWRAVQVEAAERAQLQAQWILQGALDWARLILREDARSGREDHLGEPWAVPLAEARLSTFLAADRDRNASVEEGLDAFLSGRIEDAQARYNLRNLLQQGKVVPAELASLRRLCDLLGLPAQVADALAEGLRRSASDRSGEAAEGQADTAGPRDTPIPPSRVEQLVWLGLDEATLQRLAPHVVLLPQPTPLNLNTAGREAIAAVLPGVDLAAAQRLVLARQRSPLRNLEEARRLLGEALPTLEPQRVDLRSSYFEVFGMMRLEQLAVAQQSLLERRDRDVRILRSRRVPVQPDGSPAGAGPRTNATPLQQ